LDSFHPGPGRKLSERVQCERDYGSVERHSPTVLDTRWIRLVA
jgi:hypothetical protein